MTGLPDNDPINTVREDPVRKGLLFAGSETAVYVSFDEGDHWQSLRLNMPATSIRDLVIKDDDIAVGTHGRSFWILDDITPLRQATPATGKAGTVLFTPQRTYRVRWNMNTDTPLPPEEPAGQNPPDGAIINYFLPQQASTVTLEITDATGKLVRRYSSSDKPYDVPDVNLPAYWIRPQQLLSGTAGAHRFMWDLHYTPLDVPPAYPIAATYHQTAPDPTSPWVMPGTYTVKLTVDGKTTTQPLVVRMDPRVKASAAALKLQLDLSLIAYEGRKQVLAMQQETKSLESQAKTEAHKKEMETMQGSLAGLNRTFNTLFGVLQDTDMPPTTQAIAAVSQAQMALKEAVAKWDTMKSSLR